MNAIQAKKKPKEQKPRIILTEIATANTVEMSTVEREEEEIDSEVVEEMKWQSVDELEIEKNIAQEKYATSKTYGARPCKTHSVHVVGAARPVLSEEKCAIMFHVTTAKKMLVSVERLTAAGNIVTFGPSKEYCYIENVNTKRRIVMKKKGGVYEVEVMFVIGGIYKKGILTIDSGAEECVMPKGWYEDVELLEKKEGIRFMGADGADLGNYGRKLMEFIPLEEFQGFQRRA